MIFLKKHWVCILIIGLFLFFILSEQNKSEELKNKIVNLEKINKTLLKKDIDLNKKLDSVLKLDPIIERIIDSIKIKGNEKIIIVDTMSVSHLQSYFTDRYK